MLKWDYKSKALLDALGLLKSRVAKTDQEKGILHLCHRYFLLTYGKRYTGVTILVNMPLNLYHRYGLLDRV